MISTFENELKTNHILIYPNVGISMLPLLRQGKDLMVIEEKPEVLKKYDVILFKRNDSYVLHRILKIRNDHYLVCGDNQYHPEKVREEQIIGILTAVIRGSKEIKTTDPGYKLYVHLWCDLYPLRASILRIRNLLWKIKK